MKKSSYKTRLFFAFKNYINSIKPMLFKHKNTTLNYSLNSKTKSSTKNVELLKII